MGRVISVKVNGFSCKSKFRGQRQAVISAASVAADRSPCAGSVVCVAVIRVCTAERRRGWLPRAWCTVTAEHHLKGRLFKVAVKQG